MPGMLRNIFRRNMLLLYSGWSEKNANHSSLIRNNVVPCICPRTDLDGFGEKFIPRIMPVIEPRTLQPVGNSHND